MRRGDVFGKGKNGSPELLVKVVAPRHGHRVYIEATIPIWRLRHAQLDSFARCKIPVPRLH